MSDIEQMVTALLSDDRITDDDADAVLQFAEFLKHAGPPAKKGEPLEISPLDRLLAAGRKDLVAYALGTNEDHVDEWINKTMDERRRAKVNPNRPMTEMVEIACQRGCTEHHTKKAIVELFGQTPYGDYPPIPGDLSDVFFMDVWDIESQGDGDGYCPAADPVSQNIEQFRIWEPAETIVMLRCLRELGHDVNTAFVDVGAHVGYYSVLAIRCGMDMYAIEADSDTFDVLYENMAKAQRKHVTFAHPINGRAGHNVDIANLMKQLDLIVKIDVEGAEREAVEMLGDAFEEGRVKYALIEISPQFRDDYGDMVVDLMKAGYRVFQMPPKHVPPHPLDDIRTDLLVWEIRGSGERVRKIVAGWTQRNVLFVHESMGWPKK